MYNCTIIDLYDHSVVSSITDKLITTDFAVRVLNVALEAHPDARNFVMLHSNIGFAVYITRVTCYTRAQIH